MTMAATLTSPERILTFTRERYPALALDAPLDFEDIRKGGSGRRFYRVTGPEGFSVLVMHYALDRDENGAFVALTRYLAELGAAVPHVAHWDEAARLVWLQDLGRVDLWDHRADPWSQRRSLYEATLDEVLKLHSVCEDDSTQRARVEALPSLQHPFDRELYHWEQNYFLERFAQPFAACSAGDLDAIRGSEQLEKHTEALLARPRHLIHRDLQSQNVMVHLDRPWLIDYQGMRWGLPAYDLASLVFDPYVPLSPAQRSELVSRYRERADGTALDVAESAEAFERHVECAAVQRLMQALGAYGFLGIEKGLETFLDHIPPAVATLYHLAVERERLPVLAPALRLRDSRVA